MLRPFAAALLALALSPGSEPRAEVCSFGGAHLLLAEMISTWRLPGGAMLVGSRQGIHAEFYIPSYSASTVVPVASASKLLGATRILQAAEHGAISLDAPVSTYLPEFVGEKGGMTVRQMFAHTAGYGDDSAAPVINNSSITLAQAVSLIACCRPLNDGYTVGGQFSYGGVSMHVAGRVIEVAEGGDWQALWQQNLGTPLGTTTIDWQGLGPTLNYRIAGGAQSNLRDYGRVLHMLVNEGRGNNRRVMRASTIRELWNDNVGSLPIAYAPDNVVPPVRYGLGSWLYNDRPAGLAPLIHSLGAFGFFPWVDFERRIYGVFMIQGDIGINNQALATYEEMLARIKNDFDTRACEPVEWEDGIFASEFEPY